MTHLPSPSELLSLYPAPENVSNDKLFARTLFETGAPFLAIVGPCSLHNPEEALLYAENLAKLSAKLSHTHLIMRAYFEKPRTKLGWKGLLYDPHLDGSDNFKEGLSVTRQLLCKLAAKIPLASEFVDPYLAPYFADLISWGFIGARTSASQIHRQLAASLCFPVGFKNSTDGNIEQALDAVSFARAPQTIPSLSPSGRLHLTSVPGNPLTHIVLRGGSSGPNYQTLSSLPSRLLVDCAHGNSGKDHKKQKEVFLNLLSLLPHTSLFGLMLESNLLPGNQLLSESPSQLKKGISITDPCLGFDETEELILTLDQALKHRPRVAAANSEIPLPSPR